MKFKAEFDVFVKVNVFAHAKIENENPETLLFELEECGIPNLPLVENLLYHMFVNKKAYCGSNGLLITYEE